MFRLKYRKTHKKIIKREIGEVISFVNNKKKAAKIVSKEK